MAIRRNRDMLARNPTPSEQTFYCKLVDAGLKFEFQYIIGPYIVDFLITGFNLVVEIDGSSHDGLEALDAVRDSDLVSMGYRVKRFRNEQVSGLTTADLQAILPTIEPRQRNVIVKRKGVNLRSRISRAMGEAQANGYGVEFFTAKGFTEEQAQALTAASQSRKSRVEFLRSLKRDVLKDSVFSPEVTPEDIAKFKQTPPKIKKSGYRRARPGNRTQAPSQFDKVEFSGARPVQHRGPLTPPG